MYSKNLFASRYLSKLNSLELCPLLFYIIASILSPYPLSPYASSVKPSKQILEFLKFSGSLISFSEGQLSAKIIKQTISY